MSVTASRDAPHHETNHQFRPLKSLSRKSVKIWLVKDFSTVISPPGYLSTTKIIAVLVMLSLVRFMPSISASAVPPCFITTSHIFSVFGTMI